MDKVIIIPFIEALQSLPAEATSIILFIVCITTMLLLFKLFGKQGLYTYNIVAVLAANIQVLKGVQLSFSSAPIALGTIVFSSTYLCSGVLAEHYGKNAAQDSIWFCLAAQVLMTLMMLIAIGHQPINNSSIVPGIEHMVQAEEAMSLLFVPSPRLLLASLFSFLVAQFTGIWSFQLLSKINHKNLLWLRTIILLALSTIIDTFLFNFLAWNLLSPNPANFEVILSTYITWTLITQLFVAVLSTPMIYVSYRCKP